jgi:hypothetical protein
MSLTGLFLCYLRFKLPEAYSEVMDRFTPQGFIRMAYQSGDYRQIGPKQVRGIEAVGFEATNWRERMLKGFSSTLVNFIFNFQGGQARIWIDPATNLPIQSDAEGDLKACLLSFFEDAHLEVMIDRFQWDVEMDASKFLPEIPDDFVPIGVPSGVAVGTIISND